MADGVLLSRYFKSDRIIAKDDQVEMKPSSRGLVKLKDRLKLGDWEMLYIGDGYDDYLAAKGANVFFCMITQGLVSDISTIRALKSDQDFGGGYIKAGRSRLPKFIVAFNFDELRWWFKEHTTFQERIKAVCFDLGDTLIIGGREEAYGLTDKNWPNWDVDSLLEEKKTGKKLREAISSIRLGEAWRSLGELPGMNSSEARISSFFLLRLFDLKEKDLVSSLYSEVDKRVKKRAESIARKMDLNLNTKNVGEGQTLRDLATMFLPEQYTLFIAASLSQTLKEAKREPSEDEISLALRASFLWTSEYRKHELESYRKHCKVPKGLREFLNLLVRKRKKLCIYTSKSRDIVETAIAFEKGIATD